MSRLHVFADVEHHAHQIEALKVPGNALSCQFLLGLLVVHGKAVDVHDEDFSREAYPGDLATFLLFALLTGEIQQVFLMLQL